MFAALFTVILLCGVTVAFLIKQTEKKVNEFSVATVTCEVHEKTDIMGDATEGTQNANTKASIKVKNTGNIEAYLRVRLISYWVQEKDGELQRVGKTSKMPAVSMAEDWVKGSDNTYYYIKPVQPGEFTSELLKEGIVLAEEEGYQQVVEVFAQAIQANPTDAVTEAWGVNVDSSGNITS